MVIINGLQKTSMVDYPNKISTVIFTGGCNFRCPFCQNPDLVHGNSKLQIIPEDEMIQFILERKQWIDGVCISGGEPLVHKDIISFLRKIKSKGILVKLDTNGTFPGVLEEAIKEGLVDYIAMDIKSDKGHYDVASGQSVDIAKIEKSVKLITESDVDYEFRSTVVPDFFNEDIIKNIGEWLLGSKRFVIQQFRSNVPLVDKSFEGKEPYDADKLTKFKSLLDGKIKEVIVKD